MSFAGGIRAERFDPKGNERTLKGSGGTKDASGR
jgi:hypothetical protein